VITPSSPAQRAGNVCFLADDAAGLAAGLAERRVLVWGGEGRVRVSAHLYNDAADVARFFAALDALG
jgi:selenocysteine lyase/cysteine desulfurase